jgi:hypothetical protein
MRHCLHCTKPLVDAKTGRALYDRYTCSEACLGEDRREKLAAKRAKLRAENERRVEAELKRRCKRCPSRAQGAGA